MCGIMGIHFKNPRDMGVGRDNLERFVDELLLGIEPRGKDATGLLTVDHRGRTNLQKSDTDASTFIKWRDTCPRRVRTILGHTRFATQGLPINMNNNHPVQVGTCFAIHNGHISNDSILFDEQSLERQAEVDSEIIPALLNKMGLDNATEALELLDGNYAIAAVDPERFPNMTVLAKGWSSPVELYENKYAVVWASTKSALISAVAEVFNYDLPASKIESLALGEMLVMNAGEVERAKFSPASKWSGRTTTYTGNYSYYSGGQWTHITEDDDDDDLRAPSTITEVSEFMSEECASCACERLYHGSGSNFSGACQYVAAESGFHCRCIAFKSAPAIETKHQSPWEYCDGCGREFVMGDLDKVGQKYLCVMCAKDPAVKGTVEAVASLPAADLRKRAEDIIERYDAVSEELSLDEAFAVRNEAMHEHVCAMASAKTGQEPAYIAWLVDEMDKELPELDETGYLASAKETAGRAYFEAYSKLADEVDEIEANRFPLSVASLEDACDTESDEYVCPMGQSWCNGGTGEVKSYCATCWYSRRGEEEPKNEEPKDCPYGKEGCFGGGCEDCWNEEDACGVVVSVEEELVV